MCRKKKRVIHPRYHSPCQTPYTALRSLLSVALSSGMVKSNLIIPFISDKVNVQPFRRHCSVISDEGVQFKTARVFNSTAIFIKYNQVANYIYLDTQVNKAISDNAPCDYFSKVKTQCEGGQIEFGNISDAELLSKNLEENCIPADIVDMDVSRYDEFLQQRRKMMARLIERYYKNL